MLVKGAPDVLRKCSAWCVSVPCRNDDMAWKHVPLFPIVRRIHRSSCIPAQRISNVFICFISLFQPENSDEKKQSNYWQTETPWRSRVIIVMLWKVWWWTINQREVHCQHTLSNWWGYVYHKGCALMHYVFSHYDGVIMTTLTSQITSLKVVYSIVHSGADQRKHQCSASLAFVRGIHRDRWIPRTKGQ